MIFVSPQSHMMITHVMLTAALHYSTSSNGKEIHFTILIYRKCISKCSILLRKTQIDTGLCCNILGEAHLSLYPVCNCCP